MENDLLLCPNCKSDAESADFVSVDEKQKHKFAIKRKSVNICGAVGFAFALVAFGLYTFQMMLLVCYVCAVGFMLSLFAVINQALYRLNIFAYLGLPLNVFSFLLYLIIFA